MSQPCGRFHEHGHNPLRSYYYFSCELKDDKDYHVKVGNSSVRDELHIVETPAVNYESNPVQI